MRISHLLAIAALGLGAFWYFGRVQPVQVTRKSISAQQVVACPDCGGSGFTAGIAQTCAKCGGTGQGEWRMKSKSSRTLAKNKPVCVACGGRGSVSSQTTCLLCAGTGRIRGATAQTLQTAYAELSPWEKFLRWFGVKPEVNPCPQQNRQGEYPIVAAYLDVWVGKGTYQVLNWGLFRNVNGTWQSTVVLEENHRDGTLQKRKIHFSVRDRAVVGCKAVP